MSIGERLVTIRKNLGYTQRQAAAQAHMRPQHLSDIERGRIANPSLETLSRLASAYRIGVDELIGPAITHDPSELPEGLRELLSDPEWTGEVSPAWTETLLRIDHGGRRPQSKREFLEVYLALRRILD